MENYEIFFPSAISFYWYWQAVQLLIDNLAMHTNDSEDKNMFVYDAAYIMSLGIHNWSQILKVIHHLSKQNLPSGHDTSHDKDFTVILYRETTVVDRTFPHYYLKSFQIIVEISLQRKNILPREQILSFKSSPK